MQDGEPTRWGKAEQRGEDGLSALGRSVEVSVLSLGEPQAGRSFRGTVESVQHGERTGGGDTEQLAQGEPVEISILSQNETEGSGTLAANTAQTVQNLNGSV